MLYLRSTRRMISDYVITEADVLERPQQGISGKVLHPAPPVKDPIGTAWWFVDLHAARTVVHDGKVYNEGAFIDHRNYAPFGIPYRSIVPRSEECENLLVPSAVSSSYAGYGAVRLEWTFMVLGQSAAVAAGLAKELGVSVQKVPYDRLRDGLLARGQRLAPAGDLPAEEGEIIFDNSDAEMKGTWHSSTRYPGFHGVDYLHDGNEGKGEKSICFTLDLPKSGTWEVFTRWNTPAPRAAKVPVEIVHADGLAALEIDQREDGNQWNRLGAFRFETGTAASVTFRNRDTTGYVIADAVRLVPKED